MGCGCGGESNRYKGGGQSTEQSRKIVQPPPGSGLPKVFTGRRGAPVNGPKPK